MNNQNIKPEKITKPIQLLGAWLAGLFSIDSCFLIAATKMSEGSWAANALIIASIVNVPLFLIAVFLLQTKFRPELQEDSYYSNYLSKKTNKTVKLFKDDVHYIELRQKIESLESKFIDNSQLTYESGSLLSNLTFGINRHLKDREDIKSKLTDHGISTSTLFGSDNEPEQRTAAFSRYLNKKTRDEIIKLIRELNFNSYSFYHDGEEIEEDVLLGSYGEPQYFLLSKKYRDRE